jgi:hypothetical protein
VHDEILGNDAGAWRVWFAGRPALTRALQHARGRARGPDTDQHPGKIGDQVALGAAKRAGGNRRGDGIARGVEQLGELDPADPDLRAGCGVRGDQPDGLVAAQQAPDFLADHRRALRARHRARFPQLDLQDLEQELHLPSRRVQACQLQRGMRERVEQRGDQREHLADPGVGVLDRELDHAHGDPFVPRAPAQLREVTCRPPDAAAPAA